MLYLTSSFPLIPPRKGDAVIGEVDISTTHDIESAVAATHKVKAGWQALGLTVALSCLGNW
ncbi:MAG: hypothetical protein JO126_03805 [Alphaproteobacteria bacterium]|nr:hypothetical protein [Alphaproteobacteria bacterium]MBV8548564.1 hypothetical protein [Alphaproteobacteria bacterium]